MKEEKKSQYSLSIRSLILGLIIIIHDFDLPEGDSEAISNSRSYKVDKRGPMVMRGRCVLFSSLFFFLKICVGRKEGLLNDGD